MKQAVIDIGSNSMRLSVYETTEAGTFTILFKDKIMAGLAGYVEEGALSPEGITRAILGLRSFRGTLRALNIPRVKKILPNQQAVESMKKAIRQATRGVVEGPVRQGLPLVCVGGTARAALKLAKRVCHLPEDTNRVSVGQLEQVSALLCSSHKAAADLILKVEPERIHTMIPGLLILRHMVEGFGAGEMIVSKYGVREGYLCQKIRKAS